MEGLGAIIARLLVWAGVVVIVVIIIGCVLVAWWVKNRGFM